MGTSPSTVIVLRPRPSRDKTFFKELEGNAGGRSIPEWIKRDEKKLSGSISRLPERAEIDANLNEQLIVEFYSR
jgi:small subunit ribosomal protein S4